MTTAKVLEDDAVNSNNRTYTSTFSIQNENQKHGSKAGKSQAPARAKKNTGGYSYIDFALLTEQATAHITPKNAQIILPLQARTQSSSGQPKRT